ncbi:DUF7619 domain-containing protein [Adhaeribacter pallidiroseus]|uniref:Tripartite motif-containing protein n=1 Tax=Adhaeribacter pallidiroseus TaxID=2072847 RepID=A0A369QMJ4_9BACT|nr:IPT/TIG domain-containing protein [Adhaeribacter pallidiroseus]RDC64426.1 Tripartite motif-containing protein [Adhaeribacter pallidiroseus]
MRTLLLATLLFLTSFLVRAQVPELKLNRTFGTPIDSPWDIALDKDNFLYVLEDNFINKFNPQGVLINSFAFNSENGAMNLALDNDGNMYFLNLTEYTIQKYNPQGDLMLEVGSRGHKQGQIWFSNGLALDEAGNIYIAEVENDRIQKFDAKGKFVFEFKLPDSPKKFNKPMAVTVSKSGIIYILTEDYRIVKINNQGQLLENFNITLSNFEVSGGFVNTLVLDENENMYITNSIEGKIHKFTSSGQYLQSYGNPYPQPGFLNRERIRLAINSEGNLYVSDKMEEGSSDIHIFSPDGSLIKRFGGFKFAKAITQDYQNDFYLVALTSDPLIRKYNQNGGLEFQFGSTDWKEGAFVTPVTSKTDELGNLYVLENENTYNWTRIQKFNKEGKFVAKYENFGADAQNSKFTDFALDIHGNMYVTDYYQGCIRKLNSSGEYLGKIITHGTGKGKIYFPKALDVDHKGSIYVSDYNGDRIQKFTPDGRVILEMNASGTPGDSVDFHQPASLAVDLSGNIYAWNGKNNFIRRYDASGHEAPSLEGVAGKISINQNSTRILILNDFFVYEYLVENTTKQSFITGKIYQDTNRNCQFDDNEKPLPYIVVTAEPGTYYGVSDEQGNYSIPVGTGNYTLKTLLPQEIGRTITSTCPDAFNQIIAVPYFDTVVNGLNFGNQVSSNSILNVEVASNRRRRCFRNTTMVTYANTGFATSQNAKVMVQLPEFVHFISANAEYTQDSKGNYIFAVGVLQPNQRGTITIIDSVSCNDPSIRGLTVCTKAWITPANTYTTPSNWNKAEISVTGKITTEEQARFVIQNQGQGNMTDSLAFRVFQDVDLVLKSKYQLVAGDSLVLRFTPTGRVVRVEVDQPEGHPLKATASTNLEVKSKNAARAPEPLMMAYPPDDSEPEISEDCQPILDSYDPNDKQAIPVGLTANHYTPTNTPLRYTIRFQNTGNDVAYRVVVVDTLAEDLDVSTLQVGASSHAYTLSISGKIQPILTFTFDNILLPDSTHNQAGSNGFISFSIKPKLNLPEKKEIKNYADIFFDYNEPVRTNTTVNQIYDVPRVVNAGKQLKVQNIITMPTIHSFSPAQSRTGEVVIILGSNFGTNLTENTVTFNGVKATILSTSPEELTVRVPNNALSGKIKITTPDGVAQSQTDYFIFQAPTLTGISVNEGVTGQVITLTGKYFAPELALDTVLFNKTPAKVLAASETSLQVAVPAAARRSKILIKTRGGQAESAQEFRIWYPPVITGFNSAKGKAGTILTITGNDFAEETSRNKVQFAGIPSQVMQATATALRVQVPAEAISGDIQVETPGGVTHSPTAFTFIPAPVITSFTPSSGNAGTVITIKGRNFNADNQADTVLINKEAAKILKISQTSLVVEAPKGVRSGTLTVAGAGGRAGSSEFLVLDLNPKEALTVYPNPTQETIIINWYKANFTVESLDIYNAVGKRVLTENLKNSSKDERQLSLRALPAGIYTMRLQTSEGAVVKQIIRL